MNHKRLRARLKLNPFWKRFLSHDSPQIELFIVTEKCKILRGMCCFIKIILWGMDILYKVILWGMKKKSYICSLKNIFSYGK